MAKKVTKKGGLTVTDRDLGWDEIKKLLTEDVRQSHVKVGVIGTEATDDRGQITNARLMAVHEFGAQVGNVSIPERAPIRSTFDANRSTYENLVVNGVKDIFGRKTNPRKLLGRLGMRMVNDIKNRITQGDGLSPPNADSTLKKKLAKGDGEGSPKPLVDTGALLGSLDYAVVVGGKKE